jgi:hypothetical protein
MPGKGTGPGIGGMEIPKVCRQRLSSGCRVMSVYKQGPRNKIDLQAACRNRR